MLFKNFRLRHVPAMTARWPIPVARHDMYMQVKDSLTRRLTIELHQFDSVRIKSLAYTPGDMLYRSQQAGKVPVLELEQVLVGEW